MSNPLPAIDSNIFIYALNGESEQHHQALIFLRKIVNSPFCISTQNILEIYNVLVDPKKFPFPLSSKEAVRIVKSISSQNACLLLHPSQSAWNTALGLASELIIGGHQLIYDCYLATTLLENQVEVLYTANTDDFKKYPFIKAVNPLISLPPESPS